MRLCDFGSCVEGPVYIRTPAERASAEEIIGKETTQMYRAPEMVDLYMRDVLTEKTDMWALGCILYALCFLVHPFQDAGTLGILSAKIVFPASSPYSAETHAFLMKLLDVRQLLHDTTGHWFMLVSSVFRSTPRPVCLCNRVSSARPQLPLVSHCPHTRCLLRPCEGVRSGSLQVC